MVRSLLLASALLVLAACGGSPSGSAPAAVGMFSLDNAAFESVLLDSMRERMGGKPVPDAMADGFRTMAKQARIVAVIAADGRWSVTGTMAGAPFSESGTWKADGATVKFTRLKKDDKHDIGTFEGRLEDEGGVLIVKPDPAMPAPLRLKRTV